MITMALVSGIVADPNGRPIPNALVSLNSYWTTSNSTGRYSLEVPEESYTLKAVRREYRTVDDKVKITRDTIADITMVLK